jgi:hypothetical protein
MRRTLVSLVLLTVAATNAPAAWTRDTDPEAAARSRHYIVRTEEALSVAAKSALAARGVTIARPLSEGRYLVRVAPGAAADPAWEQLTAQKKIHRRALRAAIAGKPFINVNVLFHDDVAFESAQKVISASGGTLRNPLQLGFDVMTRLAARIPATALLDLAADERVLLVDGAMKLKPALDNANTARQSDVNLVHDAPYGLTGEGVTLSFFEFAPADVAHREFEGRLTTHLDGTESGDVEHATHVAGTMIAAGVDPFAKGMAPKARVHQFSARGEEMFNRKSDLPTFGSRADNNSWGYVLGWCGTPSCDDWVWDDTEEYYGAYDVTYTASLDRITRATNVLMVHSAGNDAGKRGPLAPPFAHQHTDDEGDLITGTFCYSPSGNGGDCPAAPTCSAGAQFCERTRHPEIIAELPVPFGSLGLTAAAKNVIAVGAIDSSGTIATFSSRGPARDGRVKPDVVARGVAVFSTRPGNAYGNKQGTSMSAPAVTGMSALLVEQWRRTFANADPAPAVLKTLFIAGAEDLGNDGPDYTYGFGMVNAKNSVDLIIADGGAGRRVKTASLAQDAMFAAPMTVTGGQNLRVVVGWSDPEVIIFPSDGIATSALVNDIDLRVITPGGETVLPYVLDRTRPTFEATRGVNTIDNTEVVEIRNAAAGTYRVEVEGSRITAQSPQPFVLVATSDMEASGPSCAEIGEPNGTEATAITLLSGPTITGKTCEAGDMDFFTFVANEPGMIVVSVTATDTPLRAVLSSSSTAPVIVSVNPGETKTLTLAYDATSATKFYVIVEATGAIGTSAEYTLSAEYPINAGARRRAVRR